MRKSRFNSCHEKKVLGPLTKAEKYKRSTEMVISHSINREGTLEEITINAEWFTNTKTKQICVCFLDKADGFVEEGIKVEAKAQPMHDNTQ